MPRRTATPARPESVTTAAEAFTTVEPLAQSLPKDKIVALNVDIPTSVSIVLGACPMLISLRDQIKQELPSFDLACVDDLQTYALAAWYAHLMATKVDADSDAVFKQLLEEASALRKSLLVAAEALADRALVDADTVATLRSGQGHVDTANDLVGLSALFFGAWNQVNNKTAVELEEVERAAELGPQLLVSLSARRKDVPDLLKLADPEPLRSRTFSVLYHAYDECRRAVEYLRWHHGDAQDFTPSLYSKRRGTKRAAADAPVPEPDSP